MNPYYTYEELKSFGFKKLGNSVNISRKASIYTPETIRIGDHVRIDDFCFLSGGHGITIGDYVHIATYSALYGKKGITIGNFVNISSRVNIYSTSDDYSGEYLTGPMVGESYIHDIGSPVVLENHVIIGAGSIILPGVILSTGTAVGAMSLIKESTKAFGIYAGIPASKIKDRKTNVLQLEEKLYAENNTANQTRSAGL